MNVETTTHYGATAIDGRSRLRKWWHRHTTSMNFADGELAYRQSIILSFPDRLRLLLPGRALVSARYCGTEDDALALAKLVDKSEAHVGVELR